ncbi:MAG: DUF2807 domain-containing protein [Sphingomonas sp.]|uniref:GIN domain-containing protein n=1 Tax=Sphingomonas sp. TaxID=28214 RepID=UPI001853DF36|nr:DUF2807 domain-containing protein [Sphingomonas sp.]MBA3667610.1 DUF2807 domain-containing protein [Sphingomonas sp.]
MIDRLPLLALLVAASLPTSVPVRGAAPSAQRTYSVSSFDRIRVDGPYSVRLTTNVAPFARARGASNAALDGVALKVEGRTLIVRPSSGGWGGYPGESRGPVTIEVGTHDLNTAWLNGAGSLTIDRVRGLSFDLAIQGAGAAKIDAVDVDQMKVGINGAASARLSGRAARLTATVRGSSLLDGEALKVKDAVIGAEGPSIVRAIVTETAKVDALGLAAVTLTGKPACIVKAQGSASVAGCR